MAKIKLFFCLFFLILSMSSFAQESQKDKQPKASDQDSSKISIPQILFAGTLLHNYQTQQSWYIFPLIDVFQFNTIEGFVTDLGVSYTKYLTGDRFYVFKPKLRYGFENNRLQSQASLEYYYKPSRFGSIKFSGGRFVEQINGTNPLSILNNTYYTLLFDRNFLKIYENTFFNISHTFSPIQDFLLTTDVNWAKRNPLQNLSKLTAKNNEFTSNIPTNNELNNTEFITHKSLNFRAELSWQYKYKRIRSRGEFKSVSKYPKLTLTYLTAVPAILESDLSYQKLSFQLSHVFKFKSVSYGQFHFETGGFISKDSLSFIDFNHFNGNKTLYDEFKIEKFQLLDYYQYSTTDFYLASHYQHHFNGLLLRKISFLKKTKMQSVLSLNHLYTPTEKNYLELGIGVEKIFNKIRFDFYTSWRKDTLENNGIRFGLIF